MTVAATDVTLTGTLTDDQGTLLNGTLTFTLNGFGESVPTIGITQMLPGLSFTTSVTSGVFTASFYSNQIIKPGPMVTFYNISFNATPTSNQVFNFSKNYQFPPGSFNLAQLSTLGPFLVNPPNVIIPNTFAAVPHQFLNSFSLSTGLFTAAQPSFSDISGVATLAQLPPSVSFLNKQIFTSNGTFTIPSSITAVKVTVIGAGGGGGGANPVTIGFFGGGGGAGATAIKWLTGLTPTKTISVTVGTGGIGGDGFGGTGNNGSQSFITSGTQVISVVQATGGSGGGGDATGFPGTNGSASGGDINSNGGPGQSSGQYAGNGGYSSIAGGGIAGIFTGVGTGAGGDGGNPGGGGGGAMGDGSFGHFGGNGANGMVIFEWVG